MPRRTIAFLLMLAAGCGEAASGAGGSPDAGGQADAGAILVACNDGTGSLDCCSSDVVGSASCGPEGFECWSHCSQGLRGKMYCSGGVWLAGHGLFPCGDSGTTTADAAAVDASDGAVAEASEGGGASNPCVSAGGSVGTALCCASAGDFPNTCLIGACACAPASSHTVTVCNCPAGKCFDGTTCR